MPTRGFRETVSDSFIADVALSRYQAVIFASTNGHVTDPAAARDVCAGIVQDDASASGDIVRVVQHGKSYVIASAAITLGANIAVSDTDGRVSTPAGYASGDCSLGWIEEAAEASGDIVTAFISIQELIR